MNFTVGIVLRNLATTSNFVKFRDGRNFTFFEATRVVWDTWHIVSGSRGAKCQDMGKSNIELKWVSHETNGIMPLEENPKWMDKRIRCNPLNQYNGDMWH